MTVSNLDYLKEYSDNDMEFVIEMVELFLSKTPGFIDDLEKDLSQKEFESIAKSAHKMKPSMIFMGIENGKELCIEIEDLARENPLSDDLNLKVNQLSELCRAAFKELESALQELK